MKIQRMYRGFYVRCVTVPELKQGDKREEILGVYLREREEQRGRKRKQDKKAFVKVKTAHSDCA